MIKKEPTISILSLQDKSWKVINDGVMGGLSKGRVSFKQDHIVFHGNISKENNGGFSSAYYPISVNEHIDRIEINVAGDNNAYQLRLSTLINGYRLAYKSDFKVDSSNDTKLTFSLRDFTASFRGRVLPQAPEISPATIHEVGFMVTKPQAGKFKLKVFNIQFTQGQRG